MRRSIVIVLCVIALLYPAVAFGSELEPDGSGAIGTTGSSTVVEKPVDSDLTDRFVEAPPGMVSEELAARLGPGGKVFLAPDGLGITLEECEAAYANCEPVTVVTDREVFLTDEDGNRVDAEDMWKLDSSRLAPGINAAVGSSTAYKWNWSDTMQYAGVVGTNVVYIGKVRATYEVTLSGRQSTWKQSTDAWDGPSVKGHHRWNCVDDNGSLPNSSCTGGWQSHEDSIYRFGVFWSQDQVYHSQVETYWYDFRVNWKATGWSGWTFGLGPWSTHKFDCPSQQSCSF